jgi:hypothetical protein
MGPEAAMNSAGQCFPTEEGRPKLYDANSVEARICVSSHIPSWASMRNEAVFVTLWSGRSPVQVHPKRTAQVSLDRHNTDMSGASACGGRMAKLTESMS